MSRNTYETLPLEISNNDYYNLDEIQKVYYSEECFHKKKSKKDANNNIQKKKNDIQRISNEKQNRLKKIKNDINIEISENEYREIPANEKKNWKYSRSIGPQYNQTTYYKRKSIENNLNWRAIHQEKIILTPVEYNKLGKNAKALGWVTTRIQTGMQDWNTMYRRRLPEDTELDLVLDEIQKKELEIDTLLKKGKFHKTGYYIRGELPNYSIRINRNEYYTLSSNSYTKYKKLGEELRQLNIKKYEIQERLKKRL